MCIIQVLPDKIVKKDDDGEQLVCEYEFIDAKSAKKLSIEGENTSLKEVDDFYPKKLEIILDGIKVAAERGQTCITISPSLLRTNHNLIPLNNIQCGYLQDKIIKLFRSKSYRVSIYENTLTVSW